MQQGRNLHPMILRISQYLKVIVQSHYMEQEERTVLLSSLPKKGLESLTQVEVRNNLKETAFFFPHLKTNKRGDVIFSFDSPQALTKWRLMLLAHNKLAEVGTLERTAVTKKNINVIPNPPRFLRERDIIYFSTKISNLTKEVLSGTALLQLFNGVTSEPITPLNYSIKIQSKFHNPSKREYFGNMEVAYP